MVETATEQYARVSGKNDGAAGLFPMDESFILPHLQAKYSTGYREGRSARAWVTGFGDYQNGRDECCPAEYRLQENRQAYHGGYDAAKTESEG